MNERKWPDPGAHIPTATLMLHVDGELGAEQAAVTRHLHECWTCRERLEWINRGVFTFLDYYRNVLIAELPPIDARPGVLRTLREEALLPAPVHPIRALWKRIVHAAAKVTAPAWAATAASLSLFIALSYLSLVEPPRLTASEFLARVCKRSTASENAHRVTLARRVRIRRGQRVFERQLPGTDVRTSFATPPDEETQAALKLARVDWNDPLNPLDYAAWHRTVARPRDVIRESPTSVTLETTLAGDAPVTLVSFTVNREDWRPTSQHIEFRGQPAIDVNELPSEPDAPAIATHVAPRSALPAGPKQDTSGPTAEQLDDAEVRLREVLHGLQADLYAAPVIRREPNEIELLAFASSSEQRDTIVEAVRDVPYVSQRVVTPNTAQPSGAAASVPLPTAAERAPQAVRAPLADNLRRYCGGLEEANSYLAVLAESHSETLMAASALRSLANRYTVADWDRLSSDLQVRLGRLIDDYDARLRRSARAYDALATPVLDAMLRDTGGKTSAADKPDLTERHLSWRDESSAVAEQVQRMQSILTRLLAEVDGDASDAPAGAQLAECDRARGELKRLLRATAEKKPPPERAH